MSTRSLDVPASLRPEDERLPAGATLSYGLQHILSMFGGVIAVPILIGGAAGLDPAGKAILISCSLFVSGVATMLQSFGLPYLGSQLPLVQGISFASVFGACIAAGVVAFLVVPFFAQIVRFFPPVVTGSVITVIGLSLMPVGAKWITGQPTLSGRPNPDFANLGDMLLGFVTLALVLCLNRIKKVARLAILLGLLLGTIVAAFVGKVTVAPVFNTFPATAFAQNVGLVALTGIRSRYVVTVGGAILAVLGLSPWLAGIIGMIPLPVLGGAGLCLFGSVAASGIRTLSKVNYDGTNNLLIVAVAIAFGVIPNVVPGFWGQFPRGFALVAESGISAAAITGFVLNIFFNMLGKGTQPPVAVLQAHGPAMTTCRNYPARRAEATPRRERHERPHAPALVRSPHGLGASRTGL